MSDAKPAADAAKPDKAEAKAAKKNKAKKAAAPGAKKIAHQKHERFRGKKYREAIKKIDRKKLYTVADATKLLTETSVTKFDSSAEVHIKLGIDPKQGDQLIRGTMSLPHGTGKKVRVIAFVEADKVKSCKAAGAVDAGSDELIERIGKGWLEFDVAVASPEQMKKMGKVAKILGQKGLMPNPKAGTVTPTPEKTIEEIQKGRIEYKPDKEGNLHNVFGKVSFGADKLGENLKRYLRTIAEAKPSAVKGVFITTVTVASTMGPGVKVMPGEASK